MTALEALGSDDPAEMGSYRLLGVLGNGGMGRVYLGRSPGGRLVAVKVVHRHLAADQRFRARFASEVSAARLVSGQKGGGRTAPVLAADPEAEVPWVATGYVAGSDLAGVVADHGPLPERTVRVLGSGLAEALGAVHAQGLVHRDVKPSNVLLALDGPHLIDFGITRAAESATHLTTTGVVVGSPGFMAPEQVTGETAVSSATDVFSLGALLAYAAAGQPPFPGAGTAQLLYRVVHAEPQLDGITPDAVRELIAACLAKEPAARPALPEVVRLLADESAPSSLWLPPEVADAIGRRAVELLQLESGPATPVPAPPPLPPPPLHPPTAVTPEPAGPGSGPVGSGPNAVTMTARARAVRTPVRAVPAPVRPPRPPVPPSRREPAAPVPDVPVPPVPVPPQPRGRAGKPGLWLAAAASLLLASVFVSWITTQHDDKAAASPDSTADRAAASPDREAAALPAFLVGLWNDSRTGYGNRLELKGGHLGDELGVLVADIEDHGSATCRYRLTLNRVDAEGPFAHFKGEPVTAGSDDVCQGPVNVGVRRLEVQGKRSEDALQFSADAPVTSLGTLWKAR